MSILTNKAPLVLIFSGGSIVLANLIITCQSKQKTTNEINVFHYCSGSDCLSNQSKFFNLMPYRKTKRKKLNLSRVLLNLKVSKNRGICKHNKTGWPLP